MSEHQDIDAEFNARLGMTLESIDTIEALQAHYDRPKALSVNKQQSCLDEFSRHFISLSNFAILATSDADGWLDCSPRGDHAGFIEPLNDHVVAMPDRPGNNRLDSMSNIVRNPNVGLLFLIPGFSDCLRLNGVARIVRNQSLLERFEYRGKLPRSVVLISIREVYFHCAKAIVRSKLWEQESKVDRSCMPSLGKILLSQIDPEQGEDSIKELDQQIASRLKTDLY